jgi:hypothetical protein
MLSISIGPRASHREAMRSISIGFRVRPWQCRGGGGEESATHAGSHFVEGKNSRASRQ